MGRGVCEGMRKPFTPRVIRVRFFEYEQGHVHKHGYEHEYEHEQGHEHGHEHGHRHEHEVSGAERFVGKCEGNRSERRGSSSCPRGPMPTVIPAKAGIQSVGAKSSRSIVLDSRLRGNDGERLAVNGYLRRSCGVTLQGSIAATKKEHKTRGCNPLSGASARLGQHEIMTR